MAKTEYVVLKNNGEGGFQPAGSAEASSPDGAIRLVAAKFADTGDEAGPITYVAVPRRSWKPKQVAVEVQTRLKVG